MQHRNSVKLSLVSSSPDELYFEAITNDDTKALAQLLANRKNLKPTQGEKDGFEIAASLGHWKCFELLVIRAAAINNRRKIEDSTCASDMAISNKCGYLRQQLANALILAAKGNQTNIVSRILETTCHHNFKRDRYGYPFIFYKFVLHEVSIFKRSAAPFQDEQNRTALHWAVFHDNIPLLNQCLKALHFDPLFCLLATDSDENTIYDLALSKNHIKSAQAIANFCRDQQNSELLLITSSESLFKTLYYDLPFDLTYCIKQNRLSLMNYIQLLQPPLQITAYRKALTEGSNLHEFLIAKPKNGELYKKDIKNRLALLAGQDQPVLLATVEDFPMQTSARERGLWQSSMAKIKKLLPVKSDQSSSSKNRLMIEVSSEAGSKHDKSSRQIDIAGSDKPKESLSDHDKSGMPLMNSSKSSSARI